MQVTKSLHKFVSNALPKMHKTRCDALISAVSSLLDQGKLTLTALGRNMAGKALVKHKIKRIDRLLGNDKMLSEKFYIYKQIANNIFKNLSEAVIIIDWSGCCSQERWILQASIAMSGRSIPIYMEVHPLALISNSTVEKDFLDKLHDIVPKNMNVTIVTDAGFRTPWFKAVRQLGWHFVGRLRSRVQLNFGDDVWHKIPDFNGMILTTPKFLGPATLGKLKKLMDANIYAYQSEHKGRKRKRKKYHCDGHPDRDIKYGKTNKEPWILATSLPGTSKIARQVVNISRARMQIEQNFRDIKNQRWGFGLRDSKTENIKRLEILLIIGFIASIILWLIGIIAEANKMHYGFQANTRRTSRTLSLFSLGWQILKHGFNGKCRFSLEAAYSLLAPCHLRLLGG
jgi:hypothetical protein